MKKLIALALVTILALSLLTACGGSGNAPSGGNNTPSGSSSTPGGNDNNASQGSDMVAGDIFKIFESGTYHMKMRMSVGGNSMTTEQYFKNAMMASINEAGGMTTRAIYKDGKSYTIMDAEKMVMVMSIPQGTDSQSGKVETSKMNYTGSGTAEFAGKTHKYDEYTIGGGKTQFFVDGGSLIGMRSITAEGTIDVEILAFDNNVPDSIFEIPADYEVMDMAGVMGGMTGN